MMEFANKEYFFLLLLLLPYMLWYMVYRKRSESTLRFSDTFAFRFAPVSWKVRLLPLLPILRIMVFILLGNFKIHPRRIPEGTDQCVHRAIY